MARHDFFLCPSDPQFSFEGNKEFEVFIRMSDSYLGPSTGGNLENNRLHTNVSAPSKLNTQYVRAVSFSYTYLQRVCRVKSQCVYCINSCLLAVFWAFQSFCNWAVSFSSTYLQRVCIRVSAFIALLVVRSLNFEPFRLSVILLS